MQSRFLNEAGWDNGSSKRPWNIVNAGTLGGFDL